MPRHTRSTPIQISPQQRTRGADVLMYRLFSRGISRLSSRGRALASGGGAAAAVWEAVNALAAKSGNINMGQGFPDFPGSAVAREVASAAIRQGSAGLNQYSPQPGLLELRHAVSEFVERRYKSSYDPASEVIITTGGQEALAACFFTFLEPGDEVVFFEPCYPFMLGAVLQAGAVPRVVRLRPPGFGIDQAALRAACASPKAKLLVLNTPHNPTGHVATPSELRLIAEMCQTHDLLAVSDEVYEHCIFPPANRTAGTSSASAAASVPAASAAASVPGALSSPWAPQHLQLANEPGMRERTITLGSGGKLFALTGWRTAWAYGPAELVQPLSRSHTHMTFSAPTPLQAGIAAALRAEDGLADIPTLFGGNYQMLAEALRAGTGVSSICDAQGGYFLVASTDGSSDVDFCKRLAEEKKVVCTPMSVFYAPSDEATAQEEGESAGQLVRFTVCKSRQYMEAACEALMRK